MNKNTKISKSLKQTRVRHKSLVVKTYELKVVKSHCNQQTINQLNMLFVEAKRIYNYILDLSKDENINIFKINSIKEIKYLDKNKNELIYNIKFLSSQMKQSVIDSVKENISNLSKAKKKGIKIGKLKFKSEYNCIPLKQFNNTYSIDFESNKVSLQKLKKDLMVKGLNQIPKDVEITCADLILKHNDYYLKVTTYQQPKQKIITNKSIGIDFGLGTTITLSNSEKINSEIKESKKLKKLQRQFAKKQKWSKNKKKLQIKIQKEYHHLNNKKADISNKIIHKLTNDYDYICIQNDDFSSWKKNKSSCKTIQSSILGRLKSGLLRKTETLIIDKWYPSTQLHHRCGNRQEMKLSDRTYKCSRCGITDDRDINSAINIELCCLVRYKKLIPVDYREFKLVEILHLIVESMKQETTHL